MKTFSAKTSDVVKNWVIIDAADQAVGRVATKAAAIIRGKTKPMFTPHGDTGDSSLSTPPKLSSLEAKLRKKSITITLDMLVE
jgi:hypothetical protein